MSKFFSTEFSWKRAATLFGVALASGIMTFGLITYSLVKYPEVYEIARYGTPLSDEAVKFSVALDVISKAYVEEHKVKDKEKLTALAIQAMMKELGDQHGGYWSPAYAKYMDSFSTPEDFAGVGIEIQWYEVGGNKGVQIMEIFDGSLAHHGGLLPGDVITKVYDSESGEMKAYDHIREYAKRLKGPVGSTVSFEAKRNARQLGAIHLQRVETKYQTVYVRNYNCYLLIRVKNFASDTADEIIEGAERELGAECGDKPKGIVLDLRNNPGGLMTSAADVSDHWVMMGALIASVEPRHEDRVEHRGQIIPAFKEVPTVVLVNEKSASASEIVSKAVDIFADSVWILGRKTFGKGSVQVPFPLGDGSFVSVTISRYQVGNAVEIDGIGVTPDLEMERPLLDGINDPMKEFNYHLIRTTQNPKHDLELAEALRILERHLAGDYMFSSNWEPANATKKIKCRHDVPCAELEPPPERRGGGR